MCPNDMPIGKSCAEWQSMWDAQPHSAFAVFVSGAVVTDGQLRTALVETCMSRCFRPDGGLSALLSRLAKRRSNDKSV